MAERQSTDLPYELLLPSSIAPPYLPSLQHILQETITKPPQHMIPQQDIPDCSQDFDSFKKEVEEAVKYHLANGGADAAREAVKHLTQVYYYKPIWPSVARAAMEMINQFEDQQRTQEKQREQQHMQNLVKWVISSMGPQPSVKPPTPVSLPQELSTPQAMLIWKRLQENGLVDENYQPLVSRTKAAVMAGWILTLLKLDIGWSVFETLWQRENMRSDHSKGMNQPQIKAFQNQLKDIESSIQNTDAAAQLAAQLPHT